MYDSNEKSSNEESSERCETNGQQLSQANEEPNSCDTRDHLNVITVDDNSDGNNCEIIGTNCCEIGVTTEEIDNKTIYETLSEPIIDNPIEGKLAGKFLT